MKTFRSVLFRTIIAPFIFLLFSNYGFSQNCNNWLHTPNQPSYVRVGDLDIPGNKITIEATFNRTAPWSGNDLFQGDLVSKHENPTDCNYLLRPGSAEITTTDGYYKTPEICTIELNKTYHAAFVYDGKTLKFYRNGFLMSQIAASGNLILNNWQTQVGLYYNQVTKENFIGYINEVRIWNIARSQADIRSTMNAPLATPTTTPGLLAYYIFDNLLNKQGNTAWNGNLGGNASINNSNPQCDLVVDSCFVECPSLGPDFSFEQSACSPNTVNFKTNLQGIRKYEWTFGDGQKYQGNDNPSITYNAFGSYSVKLKISNDANCYDSIFKVIPVSVQKENLILNADTTICAGESVSIRTVGHELDFCWRPVAGLDNPNSQNPTITPLVTTTYHKTSKSIRSNLVANGDFSNGNSGFTSDYAFANSGIPPAVYTVGGNPPVWHPAMPSCKDHTTMNGNMMMVNGSEQLNVSVWSQTIIVKPHTDYAFSTWLQTITTINPAQLQFSINGNVIGSVFTAKAQSCEWSQFYSIWNSGDNTTALISIVNKNQDFSGNDFAIDDIFFGEILMKTDSVKIIVEHKPEVSVGKDTAICRGTLAQLNAVMPRGSSITWTPSTYLNNSVVASPIAKPIESITYIAEVINNAGCSNSDSLKVYVSDKPIINLNTDTSICKGESVTLNSKGTPAKTYHWIPAAGLSDPLINNPVATPNLTTNYSLIASNDGCSDTADILVSVKALPDVIISDDTALCGKTQVQLSAGGGIDYVWSPSTNLSNPLVFNPVASPKETTTYHVAVKGGNGCVKTDSVRVLVKPPPVFAVNALVKNICKGDTAILKASGGDIYNWTPSPILAAQPNVVLVNPDTTTIYKVYIRDTDCNLDDSVFARVQVEANPKIFVSKSNDVDCNKGTATLSVNGGNNYQWYPATNISNTQVPNPQVTPFQTTTYTVKATSFGGCTSIDSVTVKVENRGDLRIFVPNAFTPNNDGKNDCFGIKNWIGVSQFSLSIFNRWGEVVFNTTETSKCWDGTYKGISQPSGAFVYLIKAKTFCGDIFRKGTLVLIR